MKQILLYIITLQLTETFSIMNLSYKYHNQYQIRKFFRQMIEEYPKFASAYTIGESAAGRKLWVLKISAPTEFRLGLPHIRLVGGILGSQPVGQEILLHFIQEWLGDYERNLDIQYLMNNTIIHILPALNPDGFYSARRGKCANGPGRYNKNGEDISVSFPEVPMPNLKLLPLETAAAINWMRRYPFILSVNFNGHGLLIEYPYFKLPVFDEDALIKKTNDYETELKLHHDNVTLVTKKVADFKRKALYEISRRPPDEDVFELLATAYVDANPEMSSGLGCTQQTEDVYTRRGFTRGAYMSPKKGTMPDYNYLFFGCMELTINISCCDYPKEKDLPKLYGSNRISMVRLIQNAHQGVKGVVRDGHTQVPIYNATLTINERQSFFSGGQGQFWRILLPGEYTLFVTAPGYAEHKFPFSVLPYDGIHNKPTWIVAELTIASANILPSPALLPWIVTVMLHFL